MADERRSALSQTKQSDLVPKDQSQTVVTKLRDKYVQESKCARTIKPTSKERPYRSAMLQKIVGDVTIQRGATPTINKTLQNDDLPKADKEGSKELTKDETTIEKSLEVHIKKRTNLQKYLSKEKVIASSQDDSFDQQNNTFVIKDPQMSP